MVRVIFKKSAKPSLSEVKSILENEYQGVINEEHFWTEITFHKKEPIFKYREGVVLRSYNFRPNN